MEKIIPASAAPALELFVTRRESKSAAWAINFSVAWRRLKIARVTAWPALGCAVLFYEPLRPVRARARPRQSPAVGLSHGQPRCESLIICGPGDETGGAYFVRNHSTLHQTVDFLFPVLEMVAQFHASMDQIGTGAKCEGLILAVTCFSGQHGKTIKKSLSNRYLYSLFFFVSFRFVINFFQDFEFFYGVLFMLKVLCGGYGVRE